jgi:prevent-host-death family protein
MEEVSVRELRNYGGQILDRVEGGESMTITRDGTPVALISPLPIPRLSAAALLARWKNVPVIDGAQLRQDIAEIMNLDL